MTEWNRILKEERYSLEEPDELIVNFDAVICLHTIYHQKFKGNAKTISEVHRILKKEGFLLVNFLYKRTYRYGKGKKVEEDTFIDHEGTEKDVLHHFTDKEEIRHFLKNFASLKWSCGKEKLKKTWPPDTVTI